MNKQNVPSANVNWMGSGRCACCSVGIYSTGIAWRVMNGRPWALRNVQFVELQLKVRRIL